MSLIWVSHFALARAQFPQALDLVAPVSNDGEDIMNRACIPQSGKGEFVEENAVQ